MCVGRLLTHLEESRGLKTPESGVHELDYVRLTVPAIGWRGGDGDEVSVPAGTLGTVVGHEPGADWLDVEVVAETGETEVLIAAKLADVQVVKRYAHHKP